MRIGVIGAGNIGGTLGRLWSDRGHDVVYGVRDGGRAPEGGRTASIPEAVRQVEVVVLAVPWGAAHDAVQNAGNLSGKVLIDCTNMGGDAQSSGAEKIAGWAPGARVVKSFNQAGWETLEQPELDGHKAVMFVAGDDAEAKQVASELGRELGLDMIDAGPLSNARLVENLASLWIDLAFRQGQGRGFAFGVLRRR
ncbi:MAG TPA: NADPH-dependent F420 reductase [Chloroflexota bacterium]